VSDDPNRTSSEPLPSPFLAKKWFSGGISRIRITYQNDNFSPENRQVALMLPISILNLLPDSYAFLIAFLNALSAIFTPKMAYPPATRKQSHNGILNSELSLSCA